MNKKDSSSKSEVYIRSDGWVFSADGMNLLREGGHKGFDRFKENIEKRIGEWHRVSKPLDRDAAAVVKSVKGLVARAVFVSTAIVNEAARRAKSGGRDPTDTARSEEFAGKPCEFMRLTLTDDAYWTIRPFDNKTFREFISDAVLRAAKKVSDPTPKGWACEGNRASPR